MQASTTLDRQPADGDRYVVISADTHAVVPRAAFRPFVERRHMAAFEDEVAQDDNNRLRMIEAFAPFYEETPGASSEERYLRWNYAAEQAEANREWEPARWLKATESDGIAATVVYSTGSFRTPPFVNIARSRTSSTRVSNVGDPDLLDAGRRIYNRWLESFCGEYPGRIAGVAKIPPLEDIDAVVAEVEWAAKAG